MERFKVEVTSLVTWNIRVQAHNEREAIEEAERIASWIDMPSSLVTLDAAQHRIVGWGPADPEGR
jgi:hypothetical protein